METREHEWRPVVATSESRGDASARFSKETNRLDHENFRPEGYNRGAPISLRKCPYCRLSRAQCDRGLLAAGLSDLL